MAANKGKTMKKQKRKSNSSGSGGAGFAKIASPAGPTTTSGSSSSSSVQRRPSTSSALRVAANTFDKLYKQYGKDCCHDVYVRSVAAAQPPSDDNDDDKISTFWFVGKIARCTDPSDLHGKSLPTPTEAILSQKRLILDYAKRQLLPHAERTNAASKALEVWLAPGDSEMDTVQNKVTLVKVEGSTYHSKKDGTPIQVMSDGFHVADVGYNPEILVGDEVQKGGLRVKRDNEGRPIKPIFEINQSA